MTDYHLLDTSYLCFVTALVCRMYVVCHMCMSHNTTHDVISSGANILDLQNTAVVPGVTHSMINRCYTGLLCCYSAGIIHICSGLCLGHLHIY